MPDEFAASAGAYVLGALSPQERHDFELHLRTCADCRAEVNDLAGLPGLLSRVPLRDVLADDVSEPPDTLLPALLHRVRRARRVRRTVWTGGALALAACLIAVLAVVLSPGGGPPAPAPTPEAFTMTKVAPGPISASARVSPTPGGSTINLDCVYRAATRSGSPYGIDPAYTLAVLDRYGRTHRVATWRVADGETSLSSALRVTSDDIAMIQIRDSWDKVLLRLRWPPPSPHAHRS